MGTCNNGSNLGRETVTNLEEESKEKGTSVVSLLWDGIVEELSTIPEKIKQKVQEHIIDPIKSMFPGLFKTGEETGEEIEGGLEEGIKGTEKVGKDAIGNLTKGIKDPTEASELDNAIDDIEDSVKEMDSSDDSYSWGENIVNSFRDGMESARGWLEVTVNSISNLIGRYWESLSPPKEGPLKNIDKWGANLTKTYADSISGGVPYLENAIGDISGGLGSSFAGGAANNLPSSKTTNNTSSNETVINKNYYIQPGQMIASQGEIRNFVRMLKEYNDVEEER